jgi:hypothetical protein
VINQKFNVKMPRRPSPRMLRHANDEMAVMARSALAAASVALMAAPAFAADRVGTNLQAPAECAAMQGDTVPANAHHHCVEDVLLQAVPAPIQSGPRGSVRSFDPSHIAVASTEFGHLPSTALENHFGGTPSGAGAMAIGPGALAVTTPSRPARGPWLWGSRQRRILMERRQSATMPMLWDLPWPSAAMLAQIALTQLR